MQPKAAAAAGWSCRAADQSAAAQRFISPACDAGIGIDSLIEFIMVIPSVGLGGHDDVAATATAAAADIGRRPLMSLAVVVVVLVLLLRPLPTMTVLVSRLLLLLLQSL